MNQLQKIFNYQDNQVRTVFKDGQPYFVAKDVCEILRLGNSRDAVSKLDEDEKGVEKVDTLGGLQDMTIINEGGLYTLIIRSNMPEAKPFRKWVTSEVLPSIRKYGMYAKDELLDNPDLLLDVVTRYKAEREANKILNTENKLLSQQTLTWADRKVIDALVKKYGYKIGYQDAWREYKKELLYAHSINIQSRITNYMNSTGKKTRPRTLDMLHDDEIAACISSAVALCRNNSVNISDIIKKFNIPA